MAKRRSNGEGNIRKRKDDKQENACANEEVGGAN